MALITNVNLRCLLSAGLTWPEGQEITADLPEPLAPGQVYSLPLEAQRERGEQSIHITSTAPGGHRNQATWTVPVHETSLVSLQRGPRQGNAGESMAFRVEVSNPGKSPVGPVRLTQGLPEGSTFASASNGGAYEAAKHAVVWLVPALSAGETQFVTFNVQASKPAMGLAAVGLVNRHRRGKGYACRPNHDTATDDADHQSPGRANGQRGDGLRTPPVQSGRHQRPGCSSGDSTSGELRRPPGCGANAISKFAGRYVLFDALPELCGMSMPSFASAFGVRSRAKAIFGPMFSRRGWPDLCVVTAARG